MAGSAALEIRKDVIGETHYASRNSNDFRHAHERGDANRTNVDWSVGLRQVRKPLRNLGTSLSVPNLHTSNLAERKNQLRRVNPKEVHPEGEYCSSTATLGRHQNLGNSAHMLGKLLRNSSGSIHTIDWQLNLRDGYHQQPDFEWRRYFTRPQASFDMAKENCNAEKNAEFAKSHITPQDRRPDRNSGAICVANLRADPMSFKRWPGCEGTNVGQWRHLIEDRKRGHKSKPVIAHETTLREVPGDDSASRVCDNRSDGCLVEMLGKKRWSHAVSHDPLSTKPWKGDVKLHHVATTRHILPEQDEKDRALRMSKRQPRTDADIPEEHQAKARVVTQ